MVAHLERAEHEIIKGVQGKHFNQELEILSKVTNGGSSVSPKKVASRKSKKMLPTYQLDPFLDDDGFLKVGGWLKRGDFSVAIKHPVILPRQSHVTDLLIRHYHNDCNHGGRGMTLNNLRQHGYWIIGGFAAAASLINKCVLCRRSRGVLMTQKMADLPQDRLSEAPPFSYSGVDVFGPFLIKERCSFLKQYGLLFTCLSSRAIHLESTNLLRPAVS